MGNSNQTPRILLADDNLNGLELLEAYLAVTDYEVRQASNGEETLRLAREWNPDIILLDVMMPRISGFEVAKSIRNDPQLKDISIIMVTALDQPADVDRAVEAGTDDFLIKPIHQQDLLHRLQGMLSARRAEKEALPRFLSYVRELDNSSVKA